MACAIHHSQHSRKVVRVTGSARLRFLDAEELLELEAAKEEEGEEEEEEEEEELRGSAEELLELEAAEKG